MNWIEALILGILQGTDRISACKQQRTSCYWIGSVWHRGGGKSDVYHRGTCGNGAEYAGYLVEGNRLDIPRAV